MLIVLVLNFLAHSNPHCELRCHEQANQKLVSSCINAYKNYVERHYMTPEQAIRRLKTSAVMNSRCTIDGTKIYANQQRLEQDSSVCIINKCGDSKSKGRTVSASDAALFSMEDDSSEEPPKPTKKTQTKSPKKQNQTTQQKPPKIKFQPIKCGNDSSCISRDLDRCKTHNQTANAEAFDCRAHFSNLNIFTPVKNTMSYLNQEGGVSGLNHKIQQAMQSCEGSHSSAELCCGDSMSCGLGGEQGNKGQYLKTITNMTQIINSAGGLPEKCNALKNISRAGTAGVMAFSTNCYTAVDKCHNSCKPYMEVVQDIEDKHSQAECRLKNQFSKTEMNELFGTTYDYYNDFCSDKLRLDTHKDSYRSFYAQCTGFKSEANKANQDVGGLQALTEWTQKCEQYSKSNNEFTQAQQAFNGDCTNPANSSNPICVQCRLDSSLPQCKGINLGAGIKNSNNLNSSIDDNNSNDNDLLGVNSLGTSSATDDNPGLGDIPPIAPNANQGLASSGMGGAGGGGLGQDNIQALGSDPAGDSSSIGNGYNTNILGNASGGGGYSVSSMGYGSGGGYSNIITTDIYENTPPTGIIKGGFDLKEYLPGGKAFKKKPRLPAGYIQLPDGEVIGPKHGNIFHMMHERYAYYESLGKFWPAHYSKEKIECIKKSGILNHPPHSNQWAGDNLHKLTPTPNPPECRHFADHDPNTPDPTQIYLKAQATKQLKNKTPQTLVVGYKNKSLNEIYRTLTQQKQSLTKAEYSALYKLYKSKYSEFKKAQANSK